MTGNTQRSFEVIANAHGVRIRPGESLPWLDNRGHLNDHVMQAVPEATIRHLRQVFLRLGGNERALVRKLRSGNVRPDFVWPERMLLVEVDESQHFTSERLSILNSYPEDSDLAYDLEGYRRLAHRWHGTADRYRASKRTVEFDYPVGRRAQRAYFDTTRDLLAPSFGYRVLRVAAPERDPKRAFARFETQLAAL